MEEKEILTAIDIDSYQHTVDEKVNESTNRWLKNQLISKIRKYKQNNPDTELTDTIKLEIRENLIASEEYKLFKQQQFELYQSKAINYKDLRQSFEGLNDLSTFSSDIERYNIQTITLREPFEMIRDLHGALNNLKQNKSKLTQDLSDYCNQKPYVSKSFDELKHILKIREMYGIRKDFDDIELFDLYDFKTNIDFAKDLSDYYRASDYYNTRDTNIINDWIQTNTVIGKIVQQNVISNQLLSVLLDDKFVSNNQTTCYQTTYTTTQTNEKLFATRSLGELLLEITNPELTHISKESRQQIYTTYDGTRPKGDEYYKWNGLQVFDIDLKEWKHLSPSNIEKFKKAIFDELSQYHWFLWVVKSASGNGIHIYTKSAPAHHIYTNLPNNNNLSKYWFLINYLFKVNLIHKSIHCIHSETNWFHNEFVDDIELRFLDNVVSRITAGIRLTNDLQPLVNQNWCDLHCSYVTNDLYSLEQLLKRESKNNKRLLNLIQEIVDESNAVISAASSLKTIPKSLKFDTFEDYTSLVVIPRNQIKYVTRYNVCNTLAHIFGKDGLEIAHYILQSKECGNEKEITAFFSSALTNRKEPTKIGLDILRKCNVIKNLKVLDEKENETSYKEYADDIFKNGIRKAIEYVCDEKQLTLDNSLRLNEKQYLSDLTDILLEPMKGGFTNDKINILLSPPGSGKTHLLLKLAKDGKRILLVEPFISVIKNKVENDEDLMSIFDTFYADKNLNDIEYGVNAITTFDKFSRCNYEKISKMFDYICIDESHLLFTSSYRIEATSNAVRKLKELFFISSNDPFSAKLILMTGTETGDTHFFGKISNVIRVMKKSLDKTMEFLICDDSLDAVTRLSYKTYQLLKEGYRIIIPTNKGEIYSHKLIGMVEHLLQRPLKYGYYKRSNVEQEICRLINEQNTIGDYEVIFCSNYLSVGVDIVDKHKFASLYFGPFSGYEIEQFNARIRKTSIHSVYCIQTETNDGTTNDLLLEEPSLNLKLTNDDVVNFTDDKQIAKAKQEFIAQYDPILHKITTPGFSWLNGAIRFNREEYELVMFENKFLESMIHPVKIARELFKYGYNIIVSNEYEGLKIEVQEELKAIGQQSAKEERMRKHDLLIGTYLALIDNNVFTTQDGLEFTNVIKYIGEHRDIIQEDREQEEYMKIEFNLFGVPQLIIFKSKEAFEQMYSFARFLSGKYSQTKAKDIVLQYVSEDGILKMKHLKRSINLLKLIDKADSNDLSEPVFKILERMYNWLDMFQTNKNYRISYNTYQAELDAWCNIYIDMLGIKINTQYGYQKVKDNMIEMLNDIATKNTTKSGIRWEYNVLPDTDGALSKYKQTIDMMIENTFKLTHTLQEQNKYNPKTKHIVLEPQSL